LARVVETVLDDPGQHHTLESLAHIASMSRATFARHFEKAFDRTAMDYVRDVRLRHAARLLDLGELSIDQIAGKVGYASRSHFSRAFDERFGVPPAEFRKRHAS
jgi:AraC family transcriptional activator of mtrCDE